MVTRTGDWWNRRALAQLCFAVTFAISTTSAQQGNPVVERVEQLKHDANVALQAGNDDVAEPLLKSILELDPHNHSALMNLGYIARRNKDRLTALQYFASACAADRKDAQCHLELGYSLQQARSLSDAELEFHKAACIAGPFQEQARVATVNVREVAAKQANKDPKATVVYDKTVTCTNDGQPPSSPTITNPATAPAPPPKAEVSPITGGPVSGTSPPKTTTAGATPPYIAIPKFPSSSPAPKLSELPSVLPKDDFELRTLGYKALAAGDREYARHVFDVASKRYPKDALSLRQVAYLDIEQKRIPEAIEAFEALHRIGAEDGQTSLQLAYLYLQRKEYSDAARSLRRSITYNDPESTRQARAELALLTKTYPKNTIELYAFPLYTTRFRNGIMDAQLKAVHRLTYTSPVSVFLAARYLGDSASGVGGLPQLYSDNAAMFGGGVRFQPIGAHYSIQAEANEAYLLPLGKTLRSSALVPDYRVSGAYFRRWQVPAFTRLGFEANGSIGWYSRYDRDAIAYAIPREIFRLFSAGPFSTSISLREMAVWDSDRYFYNNIAEAAPGLDLSFGRAPMLSIRGEYVEGRYLNVGKASPDPYGGKYHDIRVQVVFGKILQFHSGNR